MAAGHDINYVAVTGALDSFRARKGRPRLAAQPRRRLRRRRALYLVVGVLAGVIEARAAGKGQVVDVAMCDGVASLITMFHALKAMGVWTDKAGENLLDGGAPFYGPVPKSQGRQVFHHRRDRACNLRRASATHGHRRSDVQDQNNRANWPTLCEKWKPIFLTKTRDEWAGCSKAPTPAPWPSIRWRREEPSPSRRPQDVRRAQWRRSAAPAALLAHAVADPVRADGRAHRSRDRTGGVD